MRMELMNGLEDRADGWSAGGDSAWSRAVPFRDGEPPLLLHVFPTPDAFAWEDPWSWEVAEADDEGRDAVAEIDTGVAPSRQTAMKAATAAAAAHILGLADE
ncbi:hypothetical protein ACFQX4_26385 [Roseomonas sp. GCM10028921]